MTSWFSPGVVVESRSQMAGFDVPIKIGFPAGCVTTPGLWTHQFPLFILMKFSLMATQGRGTVELLHTVPTLHFSLPIFVVRFVSVGRHVIAMLWWES